MKITTALLLALTVLLMSACGGGYTAPPKTNSGPSANGSATPGPKPGESQAKYFKDSAKAAFAAQSKFRSDKTPENFAMWGKHIYDALRYKFIHKENGHSTSGLYRVTEIGEMRQDFTKTTGPVGWEDVREYKEAFAAYQKQQQG